MLKTMKFLTVKLSPLLILIPPELKFSSFNLVLKITYPISMCLYPFYKRKTPVYFFEIAESNVFDLYNYNTL